MTHLNENDQNQENTELEAFGFGGGDPEGSETPYELGPDDNEGGEDDAEEGDDDDSADGIYSSFDSSSTDSETLSELRVEINRPTMDRRMRARAAAAQYEANYFEPEMANPHNSEVDSSQELKQSVDSTENMLKNAVEEKTGEVRDHARKRIVIALAIGSFSVVAATMIIYLLVEYIRKGKTDDVDNDKAETLKKLAHAWQNMSNKKLWEHITSYVDRHNPSFQFQILAMNYVKLLSKADKAIEWKSGGEKWDHVETLVSAYQKAKRCGDIYRTALTLNYNGKEIDRINTADLCQMALGYVCKKA